jgi:hypothetical protein
LAGALVLLSLSEATQPSDQGANELWKSFDTMCNCSPNTSSSASTWTLPHPLASEGLKVEQLIVDGEKQFEAIIETHRQKMSPFYARRFDLNQIRKIAQQAQDDLRSSCEDREILARFESVNEELTEPANDQGKSERSTNCILTQGRFSTCVS